MHLPNVTARGDRDLGLALRWGYGSAFGLLHGVLRRHPIALAVLARHYLAACVEGARQGYRSARTELGDLLPPQGLDAVLAVYSSEGSRLVATARAVDLIGRALRGEVFAPQLGRP